MKSLSGGVSTGMRASMKPHPLFFKSGSGATLTDVDGHTYLDYVLGWGPVILGHSHPGLTAAVTEAASMGATFGSGHHREYLVAEQILDAIPGTERVLWSNTGSEAAQVALRLARAFTGRSRFVKMMGHYHGWSDAFLLGYRPDIDGNLNSLGSQGQRSGAIADVSLVEFGDLDAAVEILKNPDADIAAVFVEPVLCNSGVIAPPEGYLEGLREVCDVTNTLLIFDEVITGFRVAYGGAVERFSVKPDIVLLAKAIAGGYPLAALAGRAQILDLTQSGVVHAGTYNGNPVVLAAADATLTALRQTGTYERFELLGRELADGMRSALERHGVHGVVNQVGPVVQCMPGVERGSSLAEFMATDQEFYDRLLVSLLRRGVFALPGGRWYISTAHSSDDIAHTAAIFDEALGETLEQD